MAAWANALYDRVDRDDARMRLPARSIATARAKVLLLQARRDELLAQRDEPGVCLLQRVLDGERG